MTPYYEQNGITIYHGDCRELLPYVAKVDAVVTDPPYGMSMNPNGKRFTKGGAVWDRMAGDNAEFDPSQIVGISDSCAIWGMNHFPRTLEPGGALVWVKRTAAAYGSFLSDAEIAWTKGNRGVYCFTDWNYLSEPRWHPTQKPVSLLRWTIEKNATNAGTILDPFMGSGTTLVAAKSLGRRAIGIEIEERYCEIAANRLAQQVFNFSEETA